MGEALLLFTISVLLFNRVKMSLDRTSEANEYLKNHRLPELLENLTSQLIYQQPENPREFLKEYLTSLKAARERRGDGPKLFGADNLKSLFGMLDPVGSGSITHTQYVEAMKILGIASINHIQEIDLRANNISCGLL